MQRKILFRGKRIDNGEWVDGFLWKNKDLFIQKHYSELQDDFDNFIVKPETVGQFTGLHDKNGKEIYEGDIMNENVFDFIVEWKDKRAEFRLTSINHIQYPEWNRGINMLIIGNIHDNPELLK